MYMILYTNMLSKVFNLYVHLHIHNKVLGVPKGYHVYHAYSSICVHQCTKQSLQFVCPFTYAQHLRSLKVS